MQTNRKTVSLMLILIGLIIIAAIIYLFFINKPATDNILPQDNTPSGQLSPVIETGTTTPSDQPRRTVYDISQEAPHPINASDLAKRAAAYAERFGSYSSQSGYSNFIDLKIYMTSSLQDWADKYVAEQKKNSSDGSYFGVTTHALTTAVISFDDEAGTASITVTTERRKSTETIGGGEPFRQDLDISFLKVNGEWLMDKAYWQEEE